MLFGLGRDQACEAYAARPWTGFDRHRRGRDIVRVGEMLRAGYDVFSVSLAGFEADETHPQHINFNFTHQGWNSRKHMRGLPCFVDQLGAALAGRKLHFILDEWVWIPVNYRDSHFYWYTKWDNVLKIEDAGLLATGATVIIPMHVNVAEVMFGSNPRSEVLWKRLCAVFRPSIMEMSEERLVAENPLWAATHGPGTLSGLSDRDKAELRSYVEDWLYKHNASKPDQYSNGPTVLRDLRNELGWKDVQPFPAFLVLTRR